MLAPKSPAAHSSPNVFGKMSGPSRSRRRAHFRFDVAGLNLSLHRRTLARHPFCEVTTCLAAKKKESVFHTLLECPRFDMSRFVLVSALSFFDLDLDLSVPLILGHVDHLPLQYHQPLLEL